MDASRTGLDLEVEVAGRRFVWSREPDVYEYAGRIEGEEDAAGLIGWEFGRAELEEMREVDEIGGHIFRDGKIGEEIESVTSAMESLPAHRRVQES